MPRVKKKSACRDAFDLFGEVPVTWGEVYQWCAAVAGITPESWRFRYYCEHWNVPDKIRAAKMAGTFERITGGEHTTGTARPYSPGTAAPAAGALSLSRRLCAASMSRRR